ncbi:MAG: HAMP domain-containing protein [Clostridia bacterium]|nr:HAMP domain-containing protein [Clostridia bacterium]
MNEQETRKRLRLTGIYRRWLTSGPALVMTILFLVFVAVFIIGRYYYRSAADNAVQNMYSNSVEQFFVSETDNSSFENAARLYVEAFEDKDIMDVWVIDPSGHVVVSSSGFSVKDQPMPDFEDALKNSTGTANFHGRNIYGESITATTHRLMKSDEPLGAVRYVVSLQQVNRQVANVFFALLIVLIAIGLIMMVSGITFIDSIVQPIRQINEVTKRIAGGDMSARMEPQEYHDEISELSENINFMADELSSTDKMKNDFISTVSHEMKTPLTAIKGWAETLQTVGDSDPTLTKRGMEVIIDEATRLTGVVEDLLDLS